MIMLQSLCMQKQHATKFIHATKPMPDKTLIFTSSFLFNYHLLEIMNKNNKETHIV